MRSPGRSSVRHCAPSPINAGRDEIVTSDCRTNYPCQSSVASDRLSGAALVSQRKPHHGLTNTEARLSGAGRLCVDAALGLVLLRWLLVVLADGVVRVTAQPNRPVRTRIRARRLTFRPTDE